MEHIVQFAIGIDDQAIIERVEATAEKEIIKGLENAVGKLVFDHDYYGRKSEHVSPWVQKQIEKFLADHKDEIINKAADHLSDKLLRTKMVKEKVAGMLSTLERSLKDGQ